MIFQPAYKRSRLLRVEDISGYFLGKAISLSHLIVSWYILMLKTYCHFLTVVAEFMSVSNFQNVNQPTISSHLLWAVTVQVISMILTSAVSDPLTQINFFCLSRNVYVSNMRTRISANCSVTLTETFPTNNSWASYIWTTLLAPRSTFSCSKSTTETPEQCARSVYS